MERQNEQLEKQNQELMDQIQALRRNIAQRANSNQQVSEAGSAKTVAGQKTQPAGRASTQKPNTGDDKTRYPEASEGNSAIFGEFNPGHGFTVGRSEYGEPNLSGYMVARHFNQLQSGVHLQPGGSPGSDRDHIGQHHLRLTDSLNVFDTGVLANGVTVERVRYRLVSAAAGMKYYGFWLQDEGYYRTLDDFVADERLPVGVVRDSGFYVQLADMIVPKRFEFYGATSYIFGQYGEPKEFIVGGNYYPWNTRNIRLNTQLINVDHSPVN